MTEAQIKHLVDRFLGWRLPEDFRPDAGISFKPTFNDHMPFGPMKHEPSGTNLFDAAQARAMVLHMIEGMPSSPPVAQQGWRPISEFPTTAPRNDFIYEFWLDWADDCSPLNPPYSFTHCPLFVGKFRCWGAAEKATHWRQIVGPAPSSVILGKTEGGER